MSENNTRRKNGLGSVRKLPTGKVVLKKQHGYLQNGKPRILTVTTTLPVRMPVDTCTH